MKHWILTAGIVLIVSACAGIPNEEAFKAKVSEWQGREVSDLVKAWGPPNSTLHTPGGGMVYTYNKGDPIATSCTVDFIADAAQKITAWRYAGTTCRTVY
ncbi:MAG: hypothetical protein ACREUK_07640 [Burkholderiales bacterium]